VLAQELEPRAYRALPRGLNFLVIGYSFSSGNVVTDATSPVQDLDLEAHTTSLSYLRSFGLAGRSASLSVSFPYVYMRGSASVLGEARTGSRVASADMRARLAVNLLGGPALSLQEFSQREQGRALGASLTVVVPTGQYDSEKLVNFGTNRWAIKPEIGYSSVRGRWIFEAAAGVWLLEDNDDFAGATRSQDPIGSVQGHLSYNFANGVWLAGNANYFSGGRTTVGGDKQNDLQRNSRAGLTLSLPLRGPHSLKLAVHTGAFTSTGADFDLATIAYQFRWGGGT
jgi:hypothetical protein